MRSRPLAKAAAALSALVLAAAAPIAAADEEENASPAAPAEQAASPVTIDLLGITDLHGHISRTTQTDRATGQVSVNDPGAVTLACEVSAARSANPNTLFVSAGDSVGGSAYVSSVLQDKPTIDVLNAMDLDASALGNHELDKGLSDLEGRILPEMESPVLAANVTGSAPLDAEGTRGVTIKETGGVRVAFVGVVTDELPTLVSPSALATLKQDPAVQTANTRASELKDGDAANGEADVVVILSHEDAAQTAEAFNKSVDAVFSGHTHVPFAKTVTGAEGNQIAVVQADHYGWALGRISLAYDPATRSTSVVAAENKDLKTSGCTTDAYGVAGIVSKAETDSAAQGSKAAARIGSDFLRGSDGNGPGGNRGTESTASNVIAESFRHWLATDIQPSDSTYYVGLMNAGGVRADYLYPSSDAGEGDGVLTSGEAYTVQPFGNEMGYTTVTGADLKALLAQQWQPGASRSVLTLGVSKNVGIVLDASAEAELSAIQADLAASGAEASTRAEDITAARAKLVREIIVDGHSLSDTDAVVLASNSFLLEGGDGYEALAGHGFVNTGVLDRDVTTAYFASFGQDAVAANYDKRQVGMSLTGKNQDTATVTLDGLAYTNSAEQAAGAQRVRVMNGTTEIASHDIDLTVDAAGPTTGRASFEVTVPADAPTRDCRAKPGLTCRYLTLETVDAQGGVLNTLYVERAGQPQGSPAPTQEPAPSQPSAGQPPAADQPQAPAPGQPSTEAVPAQSATPAPQAGGPGGSLARTGASPILGVLALVLVAGGSLLVLYRRRSAP